MSKGTVHEIAAGGFATGTNDLVSHHAHLPHPASARRSLTMNSTTERGLHTPPLLSKQFTKVSALVDM
jgi:hypothetical protein